MKPLYYLIITRELTGDSEVLFYPTLQDAIDAYNLQTAPMLRVCLKNELEQDEVFNFEEDNKNAVRFNAGYDEDLDLVLGQTNTHFAVGIKEVDDNITHYIANFSDYVDESTIQFYPNASARIVYDSMVEDCLEMFNDRTGKRDGIIDRNDITTWTPKDSHNLFDEDEERTEAYFGYYSDNCNTLRIGEIKFVGSK